MSEGSRLKNITNVQITDSPYLIYADLKSVNNVTGISDKYELHPYVLGGKGLAETESQNLVYFFQ